MTVDPTCSTCHGSGFVTVDWGDMTCPRCHGEIDAEERAAEEWKALRDSGADELTLRAIAGDR